MPELRRANALSILGYRRTMSEDGKDRVSKYLRRFHLCFVIVWTIAIIPTLLLWKDSVLWIALMSVWANIQGHFASYMAARTEQREMDQRDQP
jgi:hypothetical protein